MISKFLHYLLVGILFLSVYPCLGRDSDIRDFDQEKVQQLKSLDRFDFYEKNDVSTSYLEGFKDWFARILESIVTFFADYLNIGISPQVFEIIFYVFIGSTLVFLVLKLLGADFRKLIHFRTKNRHLVKHGIEGDEQIDNVNFKEKIVKAKAEENHTLVVRYYYLYALQLLSEKGGLEYEARKTNSQYLRELDGQLIQSHFSSLAHTFEYIWYGQFRAIKTHSLDMEESFNRLKSTLS